MLLETSAKEHRHLKEVFEMCVHLAKSKKSQLEYINHIVQEDEETLYRKTIHGMLAEYDEYIRSHGFSRLASA